MVVEPISPRTVGTKVIREGNATGLVIAHGRNAVETFLAPFQSVGLAIRAVQCVTVRGVLCGMFAWVKLRIKIDDNGFAVIVW